MPAILWKCAVTAFNSVATEILVENNWKKNQCAKISKKKNKRARDGSWKDIFNIKHECVGELELNQKRNCVATHICTMIHLRLSTCKSSQSEGWRKTNHFFLQLLWMCKIKWTRDNDFETKWIKLNLVQKGDLFPKLKKFFALEEIFQIDF